MSPNKKELYSKLPQSPGVYLMKDTSGRLLYVGKAGNLRRRVSSYFSRAHDARIERLVGSIKTVDHRKTDTAIEALILEAELIKKYLPPFNVREKDDKSFLYMEITREKFPRIMLVRGKETPGGKRFGPFTSAGGIREALRILRKIFPYNTHPADKIGRFLRPCFDHEIGVCPGTCVGAITRDEYMKTVRRLKMFFEGKKKQVLRDMDREMKASAKRLEFEKAAKLKRSVFALNHIQDVALINDAETAASATKGSVFRIEGYDVSNISGTSSVGSMVVFEDGRPNTNEYRKFRIRTIIGSDDVGMLREALTRRLHNDWPLPALILIDGGEGQVNAAKRVLDENGLAIPVVGLAKGAERKNNRPVGQIPPGIKEELLIKVRDEAHRFAISYHKNLRGRNFLR